MIITELKNKELLDTDVVAYKNKKLTKVINDLNNENTYLINVLNQAFTQETKTGSDIIYDNTINARFKDLKIKGNADTSTKQTIQIWKKNMLELKDLRKNVDGVDVEIKNNVIALNGTATKDSALYEVLNHYVPQNANENYTISAINVSGTLKQEKEYKQDIFFLQDSKNGWNGYSLYIFNDDICFKNNAKNITSIYSSQMNWNTSGIKVIEGTTYNNFSFKVQLEKGDTATEYELPQMQLFPLTLPAPTGDFTIENKDNNWYYNDTIITDKTLLQQLTNISKATSYSGVTNIITTVDVPAELEVTALVK